ncbi:hypothetical protein F4801DRAFT_602226 [Xylaria longipes]|nr:hypothetical protein F4801DRAFT_602226 [Xylaria longipes]
MEGEAEPSTMRMTALKQTALRPANYHQFQSALSEDLQSDFLAPRASDEPGPYSNEGSLPWRPFYLRRVVLLGFAIVFILIIVTIESLVVISNKNNGIATGMSTEHYLWTYGPTAFLTAVAAVWARTEYQSKLVAPWVRLSQNQRSNHGVPASRTLLLDYISQFSIFAIVTSLRNRDFTVSITLTVSIIIKVLIVLSSGLISLNLTNVTRSSYPMVLESKFVDSTARLATTGNLAWYVITGLGTQNLTLPEGISSEYAFQSLRANLPDNVLKTRVITDGLRSSLQCDAVELSLAGAQIEGELSGTQNLNVTISSPGCNVALASFDDGVLPRKTSFHQVVLPGKLGEVMADNSTLFARFEQVQCDAVEGDDGRRLLVLFGNLTYYTDDASEIVEDELIYATGAVLNRSTQLLCVPTYAIDRVEVIHNGTHLEDIVPIQGVSSHTLNSVTAWDIMDAQFAAGEGPVGHGLTMNVSMVHVDVDAYMSTALKYFFPPGLQATTLFDPVVLQGTAEAYYRQISAIISRQSLMEPASENVLGYATVSENRLTIHPSVAQSMIGLLIICVLFTMVAFFIVPTDGFLPHNPSNLLGSISLFLYSRDLLARLRYSGASDDDYLTRWLGPSTFTSELAYDVVSGQAQFCVNIDMKDTDQSERSHPFPQISSKIVHPIVLHPAFRLVLGLGVVGLIIALELLLRKSNLEGGLGDINDNHNIYIHYTWTVIPALVFGAISMTYSTIDFQIRTLAPYMALRGYVSKGAFTQLELLDMAIPMAIYREFKLRNFWALATTTALLFASLFTTLSASLFQELSVPSATSILLQANQSFLPSEGDYYEFNSAEISSLILESNFSFPRFTFNDLAFPQLVATPNLSDTYLDDSIVSISTVIPAVRGRMDCRLYEPARIHTNLRLNYDTGSGVGDVLDVSVDGESYDLWWDGVSDPYEFRIWTNSNATYFGATAPYNDSDYAETCSDFVYLWGKIDYGANPIVQHINVMGCNMTFEVVDVNTTFIGTDLNIDIQSPPRPLNSTARNTTINNPNLQLVSYGDLAQIDVDPQLLDPFFSTLVTSPRAIPISALGDPSQSTSVIAAIKFQHSIINAQGLAQTLAPANKTNATIAEPISPGDNDAQPRYNATVTDPTGRRRVIQDAASTHVLVALLALTLVLSIVGWAGNPGTDVLPRSPTTIASIAALIAGGNLIAQVPADAQSLEDIVEALGGPGAQFWLGWGNLPDEEGRLRGGENEAGVSQFGVFVVDEDEIKSKR